MISMIPQSSISDGVVSEFFDAKNNVGTYYFYLPIDRIQSSDDYTECFVVVFFDLLEKVMRSKGVHNVNYELLKSRVIYEIKDNPKLYAYLEPEDNGLGDILNELGLE